MRILSPLITALCLYVVTGYGAALASCTPSALGQACASGGLAIAAGAEPQLNLGAGNPIHLVTGNNHQQETDLPANTTAFGLEVIRHYNVLDPDVSVLGRGWRLSYDTRLFKVGGRWQVVQADGSRVMFGTQGQATTPEHGQLVPKNRHYVWTWSNGQRLEFDPYGYLAGIISPSGRRLRVLRERRPGVPPHAITQVVNDNGQTLNFSYITIHQRTWLADIHTPLGQFSYQVSTQNTSEQHGLPRLLSVTRPDGMQKRYLYEAQYQSGNDHALTGITVQAADGQRSKRTHTWTYDEESRAISSVHGEPDSMVDKVSLIYVRPPTGEQSGLTRVMGAQGQETLFTTQVRNGHYVLTDVEGAPCSGCAAPGTRARYDNQGRLADLNGVRLKRDIQGQLQGIMVPDQGWPELSIAYTAGRRSTWSSSLTGTEHQHYDRSGRPSLRRFANGDSISYEYDTQGRPRTMTESSTDGVLTTSLGWHGKQLIRIHHPHETETRQYDTQGRISQREIHRPARPNQHAIRQIESFDYNAQHRLVRHRLPEGGTLLYTWGPGQRLTGIQWQDSSGKTHHVIHTVDGQAGYRYGNGLHLTTYLNPQRQAAGLMLTHKANPLWSQDLHYDQQGRLQRENRQLIVHADESDDNNDGSNVGGSDSPDIPDVTDSWHYAYDHASRLVGAENTRNTHWYAWNPDGSMAARKALGVTRKPDSVRDASGLVTRMGNKQLHYGPNRRLNAVHRDGQQLASYRHNAFGYRISRSGQGQHTEYFYLDNTLVAEADNSAAVTRRYIYAFQAVVGFIDYDARGAASLYAVHSDLTGAPVLVTDAQGKIRWLAQYQPMGSATQTGGDLTFDLRLPGQIYDKLTGWHDNLLRTYLPLWGHYLEPDPLGPLPGEQALGYARQQPRRHVDPLGLLLFAFDGTRNSPATQSNVWKISQYYQDGPVYYHSGPGNSQYIDWDAITAYQANQIIDTQWQSLLNTLDSAGSLQDSMPIDIIGFSRGAALARHFGNLVHHSVDNGLFSYNDPTRGLITACVDLRFMGLFDTVAQFGLAGSNNSSFDLSIASAWQWVAHAVALNERRVLFPLTATSDTFASNVIEAPFIGAHADIGGGMAVGALESDKPVGDLSDVALNWMLWQARAATLRFGATPDDSRIVSNPILHDQRAPLLRSVQDSDRSVDNANGALLHHYQDDHARLGKEQRTRAETAIIRHENWRSQSGAEVGSVDMSGYARWLYEELGWQALPV